MKIYVAGPMTGLPELNFPAFHAEAARLRALGHEVVNPAEINVDPDKGWAACLKADIAQLLDCDAVALLPGWEGSRGAKLEHHIAVALGMVARPAAEFVASIAFPSPPSGSWGEVSHYAMTGANPDWRWWAFWRPRTIILASGRLYASHRFEGGPKTLTAGNDFSPGTLTVRLD